MIKRVTGLLDPVVALLMGTVVLASVLPARGEWAQVAAGAADLGIVLLFFLHGAKLSREALWEGVRNVRLHAAVLAVTYVLFPLLGLGFSNLPLNLGPLAAGLLFLTLLPSTVQSSIAFTAVARGNVAAAVCSASFSNLIGIFVTPLLVALLMAGATGQGGISWTAVETIVLQLLVPFFAGHVLRPWIGGFVTRHKSLLSLVDRGSILLVVYSSFGAAVIEGLWHQVSPQSLALIVLLCSLLLAAVLVATALAARALNLPRADAVVLQFCGSKKSLASGVPMAGVLFPAAQVGMVILPLMIFHQIQLFVCAILARNYARAAERAERGEAALAANR
jgi:solute carrier family 10 (sodium/bile acid cotransporter), member 7